MRYPSARRWGFDLGSRLRSRVLDEQSARVPTGSLHDQMLNLSVEPVGP